MQSYSSFVRHGVRWCSVFIFVFFINSISWAQGTDSNFRITYLYEVNNQLQLSDFELGSTETIRDRDGNGFGGGWKFLQESKFFWEFDFGSTRTEYKGEIEDGVSVEFVPQSGSGFDAVSSSTNVIYDFDLVFNNLFVGINAVIPTKNERFRFRIGGGRIFQQIDGEVVIRTAGFDIVTATYEPETQFYGALGAEFGLGPAYIGYSFRAFQAPALSIKSCNETAIGSLACQRVRSAAGNRNQQSNAFQGGLLHVSLQF